MTSLPHIAVAPALREAVKDHALLLTAELLREFDAVLQLEPALPIPQWLIREVKLGFYAGLPVPGGAPGTEIPFEDIGGQTVYLEISGRVRFLDVDADIKLDLFAEPSGPAGAPVPKAAIVVAPGLAEGFSLRRLGVDLPVHELLDWGRVNVQEALLVLTNADSLRDADSGGGIEPGLNLLGGLNLGKTGVKALDVLNGITQLQTVRSHIVVSAGVFKLQILIDSHLTLVSRPEGNFSLTLTRSAFLAEVKAPATPSITLQNEYQVEFDEHLAGPARKTVLLFAGALDFGLTAVTGSLTMTGTGVKVGQTHWSEMFGFPGLELREAALQLGFSYIDPYLDSLGVHGNLRLGSLDGSASVLVHPRSPWLFVLAAQTARITLLELLTALTPASLAAYQGLSGDVRGQLDVFVPVVFEDVKISIVPLPAKIGAVEFKEQGVTVYGKAAVHGWQGEVFAAVGQEQGVDVSVDLERVALPNRLFALERHPSQPVPDTRRSLVAEQGAYRFVEKPRGAGPLLQASLGPGVPARLLVSANVTVLDLTAPLYLRLDKNGLSFEFAAKADGNAMLLRSVYAQGRLAAQAEFSLSLAGAAIPDVVVNGTKLMSAFSLPAATLAVAGNLDITVSPTVFKLGLNPGKFGYKGYELKTPALTVATPPQNLAGLQKLLQGSVGQNAASVFASLYPTAEEWAKNVKNGAIPFTGNAAQVMRYFGKGAGEAARILRDTLGLDAQTVATGMRQAGYALQEVGNAIKNAFGSADKEINKFLKDAGFPASSVDGLFKSVVDTIKDKLPKKWPW
jgi:hypothetical protein